MPRKTPIPKGWRLVPLGEVTTLQRGADLPIQDRIPGSVPVYGSNGVLGTHGHALHSGPGVITGRSGSIGAVYFSLGAYWPLNTTLYVRDFHGNSERFAYYLLSWLQLERFAASTGVPSLNRNFVHPYPVAVPPLSEQRAIAAVLDSIDDAIERTDAVITATEQLRDSLLHELLTRGVPGWHTEWKDVPGLGTIPADWEVVSMGEVYEVQLGKMLSPKAKQGANPKPYLTNRNVRWGGFDLADLPTMDFDEREIKKFQLRQGDLMVCEGGDTGRAAVWEEPIVDCYYQKALHRLRPKGNTEIPKFMLAVLMFYGNNGILLEYSEQTSISHLTRERLLRMPVPNPPRTEQQGIADTLDCIEFVLIQSQEEQDRLESLKHSVADGLLTGNLRISLPSVSTQCGLSDV